MQRSSNMTIQTSKSSLANSTNLTFFINGRFLSQALTGVQRYAAEIVKAIDRLLESGRFPARLHGAEWQLLVPADAHEIPALKKIKVRRIGRLSGHAWDQIDLARAAAGGGRGNLDEALLCARLIDLAQKSSKAGGARMPLDG